jgi:CdiI N-terminal domain
MLDLRFLGTGEDGALRGLITVGDHAEGFLAALGYWGAPDYERQWLGAARRLLDGEERSAFFTSVLDPAETTYEHWWPAWREDERVYVQQHRLVLSQLEGPLDLRDPYRHVRERQQISEHGHRIAEWRVRLRDVADFVARHPEYDVHA